MFHDPLDSAADGNDQTYYDEAYVFKVFRTCDARNGSWDDRDDIADCIWCLERDVNEDVHDNHFPGLSAPDDVRESAVEPATWNLAHIRNMWLQNIGTDTMNRLATLVLVLAACRPSHESTLTIVLREGLVSPYPLADTTDFKAIGVGMAMEGTPYRQFTREHFTVTLPDSGVAIPTMVVPESGFISMGVRFFRVVGYDLHFFGETPPLEWVLEPESDWTLRIWPADENVDDGSAHFWYRLILYYGTDHELMWSVSLHRRDADVCAVPCIVN